MKRAPVICSLLCLFLTAACQETKIEPSSPSSVDAEEKAATQIQASDEKIDPPVPITGVWMHAHVLEEIVETGGATAKIGIATFYNGVKITDQRDRFMVTMTAASTTNNGVRIVQDQPLSGDYDQTVTIQGQTLEQIRAAYATISLYATVFDRNDNTTDTWNTPLDAVLQDGVTTKVNTSTSGTSGQAGTVSGTNGQAGTAGLVVGSGAR